MPDALISAPTLSVVLTGKAVPPMLDLKRIVIPARSAVAPTVKAATDPV